MQVDLFQDAQHGCLDIEGGQQSPLSCRHNMAAFITFQFSPNHIFFRLRYQFTGGAYFFIMPKFVPRQRKQKHRRREEANAPPTDTNFAEVSTSSKNDKEERREKLRDELRSQHPKVSAKKQKRLDKYIVWLVTGRYLSDCSNLL